MFLFHKNYQLYFWRNDLFQEVWITWDRFWSTLSGRNFKCMISSFLYVMAHSRFCQRFTLKIISSSHQLPFVEGVRGVHMWLNILFVGILFLRFERLVAVLRDCFLSRLKHLLELTKWRQKGRFLLNVRSYCAKSWRRSCLKWLHRRTVSRRRTIICCSVQEVYIKLRGRRPSSELTLLCLKYVKRAMNKNENIPPVWKWTLKLSEVHV